MRELWDRASPDVLHVKDFREELSSAFKTSFTCDVFVYGRCVDIQCDDWRCIFFNHDGIHAEIDMPDAVIIDAKLVKRIFDVFDAVVGGSVGTWSRFFSKCSTERDVGMAVSSSLNSDFSTLQWELRTKLSEFYHHDVTHDQADRRGLIVQVVGVVNGQSAAITNVVTTVKSTPTSVYKRNYTRIRENKVFVVIWSYAETPVDTPKNLQLLQELVDDALSVLIQRDKVRRLARELAHVALVTKNLESSAASTVAATALQLTLDHYFVPLQQYLGTFSGPHSKEVAEAGLRGSQTATMLMALKGCTRFG